MTSPARVNEYQARIAAERWIAETDMGGFTPRFREVTKIPPTSEEWRVVFDMYGPDGELEERPMVVMVNERTRAAHPLASEM